MLLAPLGFFHMKNSLNSPSSFYLKTRPFLSFSDSLLCPPPASIFSCPHSCLVFIIFTSFPPSFHLRGIKEKEALKGLKHIRSNRHYKGFKMHEMTYSM